MSTPIKRQHSSEDVELLAEGDTPKKLKSSLDETSAGNKLDLDSSSNSVKGFIIEQQDGNVSALDIQQDLVNSKDGNQTGTEEDVIVLEHVKSFPHKIVMQEHVQSVPPNDEDVLNVSTDHMEIPWQQGATSISARLKYLYEHPDEFSDCIVYAGSGDTQKSFPVHKLMLFATSSKFKNLINETDSSELHLPDVSPDQFETLLKYIYLGVLFVKSMEQAFDMYRIGAKYEIPHISMLSKAFALRNLEPKYLWNLLEWAAESGDTNTVAECGNFLSRHPSSWQHLSASVSDGALTSLLTLTGFDVPEIEILEAVDNWSTLKCNQLSIEVNSENKRKVLGPEIVSKIRFLALPPVEFLKFSFNPCGSSDPDLPKSFLTAKETFAILANLNSPGCLQVPDGISMVYEERGSRKLRVRRKTKFTFLLGASHYASAYAVPNSSVGSKSFTSIVSVSQRIMFHGIQIPTHWDSPFNAGGTYNEKYVLDIRDTENNMLAGAAISIDVHYSSFVDIFLTKSIVLEPNIPYKVSLHTQSQYFLLKMFREEETYRNIRFSFKDSLLPSSPELFTNGHHGCHGFILQVIFSHVC